MKDFPIPNRSQRADYDVTHESVGDVKLPHTKALTENETSLILKATLLPQHAEDPNILKFISNYLICRSASQAAQETGLRKRDGEVLRRRPDIHAAIVALTEKAVMKYDYDAGEVVERVKEIANVDLAEFENKDGSYKEKLSELSPETRRAVKKFKVKNIYETDPNGMKVVVGKLIEVELWDKMKAVELLGREKDIFKETKKIEHGLSGDMRNVLLESKRRADEYVKITARDVTASDIADSSDNSNNSDA